MVEALSDDLRIQAAQHESRYGGPYRTLVLLATDPGCQQLGEMGAAVSQNRVQKCDFAHIHALPRTAEFVLVSTDRRACA